jgi:hypothetical protein
MNSTAAEREPSGVFQDRVMDHQSMRRGDQRRTPEPDRRAAEPTTGRLAQLSSDLNAAPPVQRLKAQGEALGGGASNRTGLPDKLKSGVEALSGMSMDHVRVHRNSAKAGQLQAHAYAQGSDIHLGPGQDHHLPHEAWHVVQQAQGRVKPTMQLAAGVPVNDDRGLEAEADHMGAKALGAPVQRVALDGAAVAASSAAPVVQRAVWESDDKLKWKLHDGDGQSGPPTVKSTEPGQFYDDQTGMGFEDAFHYAHHLASQVLSTTGVDDEDEKETIEYESLDQSDDEDEEEKDEDLPDVGSDDGSSAPTVDLDLEDRRKIDVEAREKPVLASLLTGPTGRYPTRTHEAHEKFGVHRRTKKSGPVTITLEEVDLWVQDKLTPRERPILVEGIVEPTSTKGRTGAPDPFSGVQVYSGQGKQPKLSVKSERNTGIPDSERGHIVALELGGPDISENIVPQWAKFQGSGVWRRMEIAVLAKAIATEKAGGQLKYKVQVFYKDTGEVTPTLRTFGFPTGFKATTQVIGAKGKAPSPVDIEFHQGQAQDETDQMLSERKLSQLDAKDWDKLLDILKKKGGRSGAKAKAKPRARAAAKPKGGGRGKAPKTKTRARNRVSDVGKVSKRRSTPARGSGKRRVAKKPKRGGR